MRDMRLDESWTGRIWDYHTGKEASLKYTQAWERMGSLHFIGANIMHGSTYNPIKPKLLNIF